MPANRATSSDHVTISLIGRSTEEATTTSRNQPMVQEILSKNTSTVVNSSPEISQDQPQGECVWLQNYRIVSLQNDRRIMQDYQQNSSQILGYFVPNDFGILVPFILIWHWQFTGSIPNKKSLKSVEQPGIIFIELQITKHTHKHTHKDKHKHSNIDISRTEVNRGEKTPRR